MPKIVEDIPVQLRPAADAALHWINKEKGAAYKLTGLVDPDLDWQAKEGVPTEMALVLCDSETCAREQVRIQMLSDGFQVVAITAEDTLIPPHLDPPIHIRSDWLETQQRKHKFVVLVFYRGFW